MKTDDAGIAVPGGDVVMPLVGDGDIVVPGVWDSEQDYFAEIYGGPDFAEFLIVAANYHKRMADIVRRLATVENWPDRMMVAGSALAIAEDAAALWAEYQKEVQP